MVSDGLSREARATEPKRLRQQHATSAPTTRNTRMPPALLRIENSAGGSDPDSQNTWDAP